MASVTIEYRYITGETVTTKVKVENDYPDCLAEAKAVAVAAVRELTGIEVEQVDEGGE